MGCQKPLTSEQIKILLAERRDESPNAKVNVQGRKAAVLVPIVCREDGWQIIYTRRSDTVNDHKGQVSFPGGAVEPTDHTPEAAALREAQEEIGMDPHQVEILGRLEEITSISSYAITPVVGLVKWPVQLSVNSHEVSRVFMIPLTWLSQPDHYESRDFSAPDGHRRMVYFYEPYDSEQLWGISAWITLKLLEILGLINGHSPSSHFPKSD